MSASEASLVSSKISYNFVSGMLMILYHNTARGDSWRGTFGCVDYILASVMDKVFEFNNTENRVNLGSTAKMWMTDDGEKYAGNLFTFGG